MDFLKENRHIKSVNKIIEFDIKGIVGIRLINPTISDSSAVTKQLNQKGTHLNRDPDIIISFRDNFDNTPLKYIGLDYAGFNDAGFFVLQGGIENLKMRIPFEKIGQKLELECESGVDSIPLLNSIINLTFLTKNYVPLHASAFVYNGIGSLVAGWTKGGKTEALLSFANHNAQYVGDEWVILSISGESMFGLPVKLCIWDWQFKYIPKLLPKITIDRKILFKVIYFLDRYYKIFGHGVLKKSFLLEWMNKALPSFKRQLNVRAMPEKIFKDNICKKSSFDKLFFMMSRNEQKISIKRWDPLDIASRMVSSNYFEQKNFWEYYEAFKFAFPSLQNKFLEDARMFQKNQLECAFKDKEAYKVLHPYPVDFENLFVEMEKCIKNL